MKTMKAIGIMFIILLIHQETKAQSVDTQPTADMEEPATIVEIEPQYEGGETMIIKDVVENFKYPTEARDKGIEGVLMIRFVVEKDGSISNAKSIRELGSGLDEAGVEAVMKLKKFKQPAMQDGKPVRYYFAIPIVCTLDNTSTNPDE